MNIINQLTLRHLKQNRRRTLVTIFGTIISAAMITAVATLIISFIDLLERQHIHDHGEWHVQYADIQAHQAEAVRSDEATDELILSRDRGYAVFEASTNRYKPYVFVRELNESGLDRMPLSVQEGRLPEAPGEIVLSEEVMKAEEAYAIGGTASFDVGRRVLLDEPDTPADQEMGLHVVDDERREEIRGTREEMYTIVGVIDRPLWEPSWSPGYTAVTYMDDNSLAGTGAVNGLVLLNDVDRSLYDHAYEVADEANINPETVSFNQELLRFMGVSNNENIQTTMYSLAAIIMGIILFGSVALIYNAFAISVSERARHLGMLASVGATKKQKRNSVFFEGAVIGLISIPIGVISGIGGMAVTFWFVNRLLSEALNVSVPLLVRVTPGMLLTAAGISALTIFISTYLPARKASKIAAIDAIRQTNEVKLTTKQVRSSPLTRRLFGFEGEIGLKNMKRNKRKYRVTVFSLVVSIILFLSVSSFTDALTKSMTLSQEELNYDIQVSLNDADEDFTEAVTSLEEVTSAAVVNETFYSAMVEEEHLAAPLQEQVSEAPDLLEDGRFPHFVNVYGLDESSLAAYAETIGVDVEALAPGEDLPAVLIDTMVYETGTPTRRVEAAPIQASVGRTLELYAEDMETGDRLPAGEVTMAALTGELPTGVMTGGPGQLALIVSEEVFEDLTVEESVETTSYLYVESTDPEKTQEDIEALSDSYLSIYNVHTSREGQEQLVLLVQVFTYGFIALITLISVANIFNTISTSIALRKREFAMLQSIGMTPASFRKMIHYESIFYGLKALLYGLPVSIGIMYLIHQSVNTTFVYSFTLPWLSMLYAAAAVFAVVGASMLYATAKIKKENIIDTLKQENI
ncbi:ABC transporter permease [Alkalicoccus urumqiensis]|uniref:Cell division protein FtsX n=1 Tax=Alkalicoccus urumqiensis TaxID=1548213 RepID=A0A2P6MJG4_ALKUR|nr:ABC transporter permease [Alkalicoccus urumqiensis]PRO66403.1 cell division protein FtsX [Alkalicoccus urumqiensis]